MRQQGRKQGRVDLHIHSTASDGVFTPSEVVHVALGEGLSAIALTDHDTMAGVAEAQAAATGTSLEVIAGVEISTEGGGVEMHLLGYWIDPTYAPLLETLRTLREARVGRAQGMVRRLRELGIPLAWEDVALHAGGDSVGRPHVARALLDQGYVATYEEAFERYIGRKGPAYMSRYRLTPAEAIGVIRSAGGVPVLAHPAHTGVVSRVPELAAIALSGLEVYYPDHTAEDVAELLGLCRRYGLIATGGSDFHGPGHGEGAPLGSLSVPPECVKQLQEAAGLARV